MKKIFLISTIVLGLTATSCDSYLDINQNPNSPQEQDMTASVLMPAAEMNLAATYGDLLRIPAGYFTQHYAQDFGTSNYLDYSRFEMSATRSSTAYAQLMSRTLKSLESIRLLSKDREPGTYLAATTLRAFSFQALVDAYGEVPFTEAFAGLANQSPKYDKGEDIYAALVAEIDEALAAVSEGDKVATNFLFPDEDATPWIQFANGVKLKLLMRESGVKDVRSQLSALIEEGNFPQEDVAYAGCWTNEIGQANPFYQEEFASYFGSTQVNICANVAIVGTMLQTDANGDVVYQDGRLAKYFSQGSSGYTGGISGSNFSTSSSFKAAYWCRPVASYDMPVYLLTVSEIEFFLSEFYAQQNNEAQAAAHYEAAVEASFNTVGAAGAAETIAKYPYDQANYKQVIGIAKWVALAGVNNYESWCELRRLKYPAFGTVKGDDMYNQLSDNSYKPELYQPGTLYTPIKVFGNVGENKVLARWPYPSSSVNSNGNAPQFANSDYTKPVFWAN